MRPRRLALRRRVLTSRSFPTRANEQVLRSDSNTAKTPLIHHRRLLYQQ